LIPSNQMIALVNGGKLKVISRPVFRIKESPFAALACCPFAA
jgi:hypothetical protein